MSDAELVARAKNFYEAGDFKSAQIDLISVLQKSPNNAEARWLLGHLHYDLGDYPGAEKEYLRARKLGIDDNSVLPALADVLLGENKFDDLMALDPSRLAKIARAEVLAAQGAGQAAQSNYDAAEARLKEALALQPASPYVQTKYALLQMVREKPEEALRILGKVLSESSNYAPAWNLKGQLEDAQQRFMEAEQAFTHSIDSRVNNWGDHLQRAFVRIKMRKFPEAQSDIDRAKTRLNKNHETHYAQGMIYYGEGKYSDAVQAYESALNIRPDHLPSVLFLGISKHALGELEQADALLTKYIALNPRYIPARKALAQIRLSQGRAKDAEALVWPAVQTNPDDEAALRLLGLSLIQQDKVADALPYFEKLVSLSPESVEINVLYGKALLVSDDPQTGVFQLQTALNLDPLNEEAYKAIAGYFLGKGDGENALAIADAYVKADPRSARAYLLRGRIHAAQSRPTEAQTDFETARLNRPDSIEPIYSLASLKIAMGEYDAAASYYHEALTVRPDDLPALMGLANIAEKKGQKSDLLSFLKRATAAHPHSLQANIALARYHLLNRDAYDAEKVLSALDSGLANDYRVLSVKGRAQLMLRDGEGARSTFISMLQQENDNSDTHYLLALAQAQLGDVWQVRKELETALQLEPANFPARLAFTRFLIRSGEIEQAALHLRYLKEAAPKNADVRYLEAAVARRSASDEQALEIYEELLKSESDETALLSFVQQLWGMKDRELAIQKMTDWLRTDPSSVAVRLYLANAYSNQDRIEDAVREYKAVLALDGKNLIALNNLAVHLREREPHVALEYAQRAESSAPDSAIILDTLALSLSQVGDFARALRVNSRAMEKDPGNRLIQYHRALIFKQHGEIDRARSELRKILSDDQAFPERRNAESLMRAFGGG